MDSGTKDGMTHIHQIYIRATAQAIWEAITDPGWNGKPVMELGNLGALPVALYPGMRICAFTFEEVSSRVDVPYQNKKGNKYAGQKGPRASRLTQEVRKKEPSKKKKK